MRSDPERQKALTGSLIGACSVQPWRPTETAQVRSGWLRAFDDPILVPCGRALVTLKDAGSYITKLPKAEHEAPEWQAAAEALLLVAERDGPTMLARIGIMGALNRHGERVFEPSGKKHHWGKRKLARDR